MSKLTPVAVRALQIIRDNRPGAPKEFGRLMWPDAPAWTVHTKCGPYGVTRGGGITMASGAFLGKLKKRGLITYRHVGRARYAQVEYVLTEAGKTALAEVEGAKA